jgi:acyl-coenzyme A thioesterase PaaI-like protein
LSLTTSFLAPARSGRLTAIGRRIGGGRNIFFATAEISDEQGTLLAHGEGVFRYRD